MNIIEIQDSLKDLPDSALMREMQMPSGTAPQFLVLSELKRRKRMREDFQRRQNEDMKTVAEEVVTAAGAPQEGIMQMSRAMAPNSSIAQNTGMDMAAPVQPTQAPQQPQMMADGGVVKMRKGGVPEYAQKAVFLDNVRESVNSGNWSRERPLWVETLGEDFVREAESALMPFGGLGKPSSDSYINPRQQEMERLGIFGNSPGRNIGGEGIASVATSVEQFMPEPEDPLKPTTGFGSNPAYTYETFLEENFLNDTPEAQEMFIKYKNYMNEQGPQSDPSLFTPDLDVAPEASVAPDSEPAPSFDVRSDADPRLGVDEFLGMDLASDEFKDAAETLYPEGIGSAQQEFISDQNKDFAPPSETLGLSTDVLMDGVSPDSTMLPSFADPEADAAQRALEESFADQRASRSILKEMPGAIKAAPSIIYDAASEYLTEAFGPSEEEDVVESETTAIPEGFTLGDGTTAEGALSFGDLLPKDTSTSPAGKKSTSTSSGTGGGVGGRIAQMLADREKSAEADKWMALAQTGMALMASKQPTLGGALGEAGLIGVGAMQKARQQYDKDVLDLLTLQERSSRAASKGGLTASNMISLMDDLRKYKGDIQDRIDAINSPTNLMDEEEKARQLESLQQELFRTDIELGTYRNALRGTGSTGGQSFDVSGGSQSQGGVGLSLGTPTS